MAVMENPGASGNATGVNGTSKAASFAPEHSANATRNANALCLSPFAALDPATLASILRDAISARRDYVAAADVLALEADFRAALVAKLGGGQ